MRVLTWRIVKQVGLLKSYDTEWRFWVESLSTQAGLMPCTELPTGRHSFSNSSISGALSSLRMHAPL